MMGNAKRGILVWIMAVMTVGAAWAAGPKATLYANGVQTLYETTTARTISLGVSLTGGENHGDAAQWWLLGIWNQQMFTYLGESAGWGYGFDPFFASPAGMETAPTGVTVLKLPEGVFEFILIRSDTEGMAVASRLLIDVRESSEPVKIGVLVAGSGPMEAFFVEFVASTLVAVDSVSAHLDREVIHVMADTESTPAVALECLQTLAEQGIRTVVAPVSSAELAAIRPYADAHDIFLINPVATDTGLSFDDTTYNVVLGNDVLMQATAEYAKRNGIATVIPLYRDDTYGRNMVAELTQAMMAQGVAVPSSFAFSPEATDYSQTLSLLGAAIRNAREATAATRPAGRSAQEDTATPTLAVHLIGYIDESIALLKAAAQGDPELREVLWIGSDGLARREEFMTSGNEDALAFATAVSFVAPTPTLETAYPALPSAPSLAPVCFDITFTMEAIPTSWCYFVHDAVWLAAVAEAEAGGVGREAFAQTLTQTAAWMTGCTGALAFGENGTRAYGQVGFYSLMAETGRWTPVAGYAKPLRDKAFSSYSVINYKPDMENWDMVRIGVMLPYSGSAASIGRDAEVVLDLSRLILMPLTFLSIPVPGYINYRAMDTAGDPETALAGIQQLHEMGVRLVIGPYTSDCLAAVVDYATEHDMVLISPTSTSMALAKPDNVYRLSLNDAYQAKAFSLILARTGHNVVIPIARADSYGDSLVGCLPEAFSGTGVTVATAIRYEPETLADDLSSVIASAEEALAGAKAVQGANPVFLLISYDEGVDLLAAAFRSTTLDNVRWFGADGIAQSQLLLETSSAATFARNVRFTCFVQDASVTPEIQDNHHVAMFAAQQHIMAKMCGFRLTGRDISSYDAMSLAMFAYLAKSFEVPDLATMKDGIELAGNAVQMTLPMRFDANGDRTSGQIGFYEVSQGASGRYWRLAGACTFFDTQWDAPYVIILDE